MHFVDLLTILCVVSMLGTEFTVSTFINSALAKLDRETWSRATPVLAQTMGRAMPFWYFLGLFFIGVEAYLRRSQGLHLWIDLALLLWIVGILYSVTMLVPINNRIIRLDSSSSSSAAMEHKHWNMLHRWRVVLLGVAVVCLIGGMFGFD
jgi:uncharacterized membrane protein